MEMLDVEKRIRDRVENLPALNAVVLEVLRRIGKPDCSTKEVSEVIASDASLASRVLRLANSAYYGLPQRVEAVSLAVPMLGLRTVRRLVMGVATFDVLSFELTGYGDQEGVLWAHSLGTAVAAERICEMVDYRKVEELRLVALLHDIGKVVLSPFILDAREEGMAEELHEGGLRVVELERELCGIDHAEVGALIIERWNLSPRFAEIIRHHHEPEHAPEMPKATSIVNLADTVARMLMKSDEPVKVLFKLDPVAMRILNLKESTLVPELISINQGIREELGLWLEYSGKPRAESSEGGADR